MLYRNDGLSSGTLLFTRITDQPPVLDARTSRSANWVDVNNDGNPDQTPSNKCIHEKSRMNSVHH